MPTVHYSGFDRTQNSGFDRTTTWSMICFDAAPGLRYGVGHQSALI
jgi:hypothetical protein